MVYSTVYRLQKNKILKTNNVHLESTVLTTFSKFIGRSRFVRELILKIRKENVLSNDPEPGKIEKISTIKFFNPCSFLFSPESQNGFIPFGVIFRSERTKNTFILISEAGQIASLTRVYRVIWVNRVNRYLV